MITHSKFSDSKQDKIIADSSLDFNLPKVGSRLLNALKKYLMDAFKEAGLELKGSKSKTNPDGSITHKMTFLWETDEVDPDSEDKKIYKEFDFYVNGKPTDDTKKFVDLSFKYPDLKSDPSGDTMKEEIDKYLDVPNTNADIIKKCQQMLNSVLDVDTIESFPDDLTASEDTSNYKLLKFDVNKVTASVTGYKLRFSKIYANYSPIEVRSDIDVISGDSEFLESLTPNQSSSFGVLITDDTYDLDELNEFDTSDQAEAEYIDIACNAILDQAYKFYCDSKFFSYVACGSDKDRVISLADSYCWRIQNIIDSVSRKLVEHRIYLDNPCSQIKRSMFPAICNNQSPHWKDFETVMCEDIQDLLQVLTLYASNFPRDEEVEVQEWIRSWTSEMNYNLLRSNDN